MKKQNKDWKEAIQILGMMRLDNDSFRLYEVKKLIKFVAVLLDEKEEEMKKITKEKNRKLQRQIVRILNDNEYYLPEMIIEEVEPFFWRLSPRWVKDKAEGILNLIFNVQNEKTK
jgi:putative SOS response-associated peptidase YedK